MKVIYVFLLVILCYSCKTETKKEFDSKTKEVQNSAQLDTLGLANFISHFELDKDGSLKFQVSETSQFAVLHGYIDSTTPAKTQKFIESYPDIKTLVFMQIDGSKDDDANLKACQLLNQQTYTHYLPGVEQYNQDAFIASGGVDMFFSGKFRIVEPTAEVGVHSWNDGINEATDFARNDSIHYEYINYYKKIGLSNKEAEDFYFFTINSAPHDSIHFMSNEEITRYKLRNE